MVDYWGTKADPNYGYSPYSGQLHYGQHKSSSEPFTSKAGDNNSMTIEEIRTRIRNMHPERISALGDQWQNAWTVMDTVRTFVLQSSNLLHDEHWQSPKARNAFMGKGPGEVLAYLDVWMEAAQRNVTALRHLVQIAIDARRDIDNLWDEYQQKLQGAQKVDLQGQLSEWFDMGRYGMTTWGDAEQWQIKQQVDTVSKEYQEKAQQLAYRVGNEHYEYTSMVSTGVGPPYRPMNAVLNTPGAPPMVNPPGLPPGVGAGPPPPVPVRNQPPPPGKNLPNDPNKTLPGDPGKTLPNDPNKTLPNDPGKTLPNDPNKVSNPPPNPSLVTTLPPPPPAFTNPNPKQLPGNTPGQAPSQVKPPGTAPSPGTTRAPNPGQLVKNAFTRDGNGQLPPSTQPPGKTLRRPNTPGDPSRGLPGQPQQGRPGERRDGRAGDGDRMPGRPNGTEDAFGRPSGNTAPPVLRNPNGERDRVRPGSKQDLRPTTSADDTAPRDGTTPPVLRRPTRTDEPPAPARGRQDRKSAERDRNTAAGAEWIGAEHARGLAGSPVLDAPAPPPTGSRVSKLEEVPKVLRSRTATRPTGPARIERPGTVSPELSRRRTGDQHIAAQQQTDDEARGLVTDEQAFEVQTPGGAVVTSRREEAAYEPEIRRILGGR